MTDQFRLLLVPKDQHRSQPNRRVSALLSSNQHPIRPRPARTCRDMGVTHTGHVDTPLPHLPEEGVPVAGTGHVPGNKRSLGLTPQIQHLPRGFTTRQGL